jgi:hypothetical protein
VTHLLVTGGRAYADRVRVFAALDQRAPQIHCGIAIGNAIAVIGPTEFRNTFHRLQHRHRV